MITIITLCGYFTLCLVCGWIATRKRLLGWKPALGFFLGLVAALFLTPLVVFVVLVILPTRPDS